MVGRMIRAMPEDITRCLWSAFRSIPGGGASDAIAALLEWFRGRDHEELGISQLAEAPGSMVFGGGGGVGDHFGRKRQIPESGML